MPLPGSNCGCDLTTLIETFVCSIWCGATRFLHTETTRSDRALSKIFGWKKILDRMHISVSFQNFQKPQILNSQIIFQMAHKQLSI